MTIFAQDTFAGRTVGSGLGAASDGINTWQAPNLNTHAITSVGSSEGNTFYDNAGTGISTYAANLGFGACRDVDVSTRFSLLSLTGSTEFGLVLRYKDANNWYRVDYVGSHLFFIKNVAGTKTTTSVAAITTLTAGTYYHLRFKAVGNALSATIWQDGNSEPAPQWSGTDTDVTLPGLYGFVALATGITSGTGINFDSFLAQSVTSQLTAIYVNAATGSDSNPGTQAFPVATLQQGLNLAAPGSIVHVAPMTTASAVTMYASGTGGATVPLAFPQSSAPGTRIVVQSDSQAAPGVSAAALQLTGAQFPFQILGSYVDILGFEVGGDSLSNVGIHWTGPGVSVQHCYVHDIQSPNATYAQGGGGILGTGQPANNALVNANLVVNTGTAADLAANLVQPIYVQSDHCTVTNNVIIGSYASGITAYHYANVITITNNFIANTYEGVLIGGVDGGVTCDNSVVANNIFYWHGSLYSGGGASVYGTYIVVKEENSTGVSNQYLNNLVWGPTTGTAVGTGGHGPGWMYQLQNGLTAVGTINADPKVVSYLLDGTGDYHLLPGSPAIAAGTSTGAPAADYDGIARPFGTSYDIGAFEFHGGIFYTYGNFQINDHLGGLGYFLMSKDLDFPEFKPAISPLALYDGNKITGYQVAHRQIQCDIYVVGTSRVDCIARKDRLEAALTLRDQQLILHEDGRYWIANAISGKAKFAAGKGIVQAQIPVMFVCANPYAIAAAAATPFDSGNVAYTTVVVAGSYRSPVFYMAAGGTIYTWPTITLTHQLATPGSTTLNGALTAGNNYTAITVTSSPALSAGQVIKLSWTTGGNTFVQKLTVSGTVTAGATSISVNGFTASASFPITSTTVSISTAWNNVTIAQLTDNYSIQANGNGDQTYEIIGGTSVVSGVFLLPQVQNDFITIVCDPTATNGWTITGTVQGVSFTYQPNGAFPPLEPGTTQFQVVITADNQPTARLQLAWTPRYTS